MTTSEAPVPSSVPESGAHGPLRAALHRARLRLRQQWYAHLAPHRGVTRGRTTPLSLDDWVERLGHPGRIVVVGAGPTALGLDPEPDDLHVATNSSEQVVRDLPYVNFLAEHSMVVRFIKRGPASPTCRGTFFRVESLDGDPRQMDVSRRITRYCRSYVRSSPDLVACDLEEGSVEAANFGEFDATILDRIGQGVRQYNSGVGAIYLGYYLALRFDAPLHIYGIDAGVGGQRHFDGSVMASPSVVSDRTREKLSELYELLRAQEHVAISNHSAFEPF